MIDRFCPAYIRYPIPWSAYNPAIVISAMCIFKEAHANLNPLTYRDSLGVVDDLRPPRAMSVKSGR